jgi:hypothetical protein
MAQSPLAINGDHPTARDLEVELEVLERRLREGEDWVRRGREAGEDPHLVERWEAAWIKLLRQYELLCDRRQRLANAERRAVHG